MDGREECREAELEALEEELVDEDYANRGQEVEGKVEHSLVSCEVRRLTHLRGWRLSEGSRPPVAHDSRGLNVWRRTVQGAREPPKSDPRPRRGEGWSHRSNYESRACGLIMSFIQVYCEFESYQNRIHTQRMMHVATLFNVATLLFKIPDTREHTIVRE